MAGKFAISNEIAFGIVAETVIGTTPATPVFQLMPITAENLSVERDYIKSAQLEPSRNVLDSVLAKGSSQGTIDTEMQHDSFDALIEALLQGTWAADKVKNGTTNRGFTIETKFNTTPAIYKRMSGMEVDKATINIKTGEIITVQWTLTGRDGAYDSAIFTGATYTAAATKSIIAAPDVSSLSIAGLTDLCVPSMSISFDNSMRQQMCIGSVFPHGIGSGTFMATMECEAYMSGAEYTLLTNFVNSTEGAAFFKMGKVANEKYTVSIPRSKITKLSMVSGSKDTDVMAKMTIDGLLDATLGATVEISRNVA
jgi:hypothetical protein